MLSASLFLESSCPFCFGKCFDSVTFYVIVGVCPSGDRANQGAYPSPQHLRVLRLTRRTAPPVALGKCRPCAGQASRVQGRRALDCVTASRTELLVLHTGALGDCVLSLHLVAALKRMWGGPHVTVAARSSIVHWAKRHGFTDEARSIEDIGIHSLYNPAGDLHEYTVRFLRGFDHIVSFLGGCSEIVSERLAEASKCKVIAIDPQPSPRLATHIVGHWVEQLHGYGLSVEAPSGNDLQIPDRRELREQLRLRFTTSGNRIVLCHPGSGGLEKCCPHDVFERIVGELMARGSSVAWMIGPDEMERFGIAYAERLEQFAPVLYEESVAVAADLAAGADVFIGNDAGMTHVAALCGVKTIALFGPTDPTIWHPLGPHCTVMSFCDDQEAIEALIREIVAYRIGPV